MKKEYLKEAIELEEPIEVTLPPVEIVDDQVDNSTEEVQSIEDNVIKENAITGMLSKEITDTYQRIEALKSAITTMKIEMPQREDIVTILNELIDNNTFQIGMLQKTIDLIDGKSEELILNGSEEANGLVN